MGGNGITDAVIDKTDKELEIHELLKVKIDADRDELRVAADALASGTRAEIVQIIGKVVILYRWRSEKPTIELDEVELQETRPGRRPGRADRPPPPVLRAPRGAGSAVPRVAPVGRDHD